MSISLLGTKFYIPPRREFAVARPHLFEKLVSAIRQTGSFVIISGPAGFGKTTLLSQFISQDVTPVAWLSLDEGDNDPVHFWTYLISACQKLQAGVGESAIAMMGIPQPLPPDAAPTQLINDLDDLDEDLVLVLDDYHIIHDESIQTGMLFLLEHLPKKFHPIISTRVDPPWPLSRFRVRNQLYEIRTDDLRFTISEAGEFLNHTMGLNLSTGDIAALGERTEGWIAGLQMAALSMEGRSDRSGFVKAFSGSHTFVAEYLVEEVLRRQPDDMREFLLKTSVLESLNAGLCEAVTGQQGMQEVLQRLQKANLFVIPLDDESQWFRYHHLFSDLLQAHLKQTCSDQEIAELHERAARWYEREDMKSPAMEHALAAADYPHALQILEKIVLPMILKAYFKTVEDWLQAIPPEYLSESPRVNLAFAWMQLLRRDFAQASPYMERLQRMFSTLKPDEIEPALLGEWLALQSMQLNAQGKIVESRNLAEQALIILPEDEAQVRGRIYMSLAQSYEQTQDYERAIGACEQIVLHGRSAGDLASEMFGLSYMGLMYIQQGKLSSSERIASEALQRIELTGSFSPFSATFYGELAQVFYHRHLLEQARTYFLRSVELSTKGGFSDAEIYHCVFLSRLLQMEGDLQASLVEIEKALSQIQTAAPVVVKEEVIAQQTSIYLASNCLAEAQYALKPYGFSFEGGFTAPVLAPNANIPYYSGMLYDSALRILLYRGRTKDETEALRYGIQLASLIIDGSLRCKHLPIVLKTYLLRSQMQVALGNRQAGLADIARALELGEPEGFISDFVEEGEPIEKILMALQKSDLLGKVRPGYVQEILTAFSQKLPPGQEISEGSLVSSLVEPLTSRELEVLCLIAEGNSNQAIAEKLVITVSAVKKHTSNIYGKLNVNSRTQAVRRARQLLILRSD